ncbi:MAG: MFS transporter [Terriglobales bacterium]
MRTVYRHAERWLRIVPAAVLVYIVAYMDRVNIGFAMAGGMNESLHLSAVASGTAAGMFFWGYLLLQVPGGHFAEHRSPKRFLQWSIVAWAVISALTAFVRSGTELLVMRFLLGLAEGGAYPAILVLIGRWFTRAELGRANGLFMISLPLSAAISNPVSGWIVSHYSWRGLFLFEGTIAFALLLVWVPLICDDPAQAAWFRGPERQWLLSSLAAEKAAAQHSGRAGDRASYSQLLVRKDLWLMIAIYFFFTASIFGFLFWLPTILKGLTETTLTRVGWLSALPLLASAVGVYVFGALSDRSGNRRWYCAAAMIAFGVFFGAAFAVHRMALLAYGLLLVAGFFSKAMLSPFWSMPTVLFAPGVSGGARGVINGIANIGGFVGPVIVGWLTSADAAPGRAIAFMSAMAIAGGILTMLLPASTARFASPGAGKNVSTPTATGSDARLVRSRRL